MVVDPVGRAKLAGGRVGGLPKVKENGKGKAGDTANVVDEGNGKRNPTSRPQQDDNDEEEVGDALL